MDSILLNKIKEAAVDMAIDCGRIHMQSFRHTDIGIDTKSNVYDVVTKVDKECEDLLVSMITDAFPDHSIIGEETGSHIKDGSDWAWVIDPLDGTNSYSQGLPVFCVSIGVTYKGEAVVAVVYAPYLDEMYTAVKGEGAYMGRLQMPFADLQKRLKVSQKTDLGQCVVASGFPYDKATHPCNNLSEVSAIVPQVRGFRRMGSAAYDLCCTAMGTIDVYWEYNLNPWDACAGQLIVQEAGGQVVPICDNRNISIIAGPTALVSQIAEIIKS